MSAIDEVVNFVTQSHFNQAEGLFRAENRSEINSRLLGWNRTFIENSVSPALAPILTAVLGELGNNAFDHNLGQWTDLTGCLIGIEFYKDKVRIAVGDRGQGIANSLRRVKPTETNNALLLKAAFEEKISGRSPERRGNGLKFIRKNFFGSWRIGIDLFEFKLQILLGQGWGLG